MRIRNLFIILLLSLFVPFQVQAKSVNTSKFYEAAIAYKNGDYVLSIKLYEEILQEGIVSGNIYYNLGNSYFKHGDIGRAIISYERAKRLIPLDSDLKSNFDYVSSLLEGKTQVKGKNLIVNIVAGYSDRFTLDDLASLCIGVYLFFGIFIFLCLFLGVKKRKIVPVSIVLLLFLIFNLVVLNLRVQKEKSMAIIMQKTDATFEPVDDSTVHFSVGEGAKVKMLNQDGDWVKIKRPDGKMGWIKVEVLEKI